MWTWPRGAGRCGRVRPFVPSPPLHVLRVLTLGVSRRCVQLRRFIKDGTFTVDMATITGITPLHFACEIGSLPVAEFLVAEGADVNAYDNVRSLPPHPLAAHALTFRAPASPPPWMHACWAQSGVRPLHTAVVYEKADLVRFLLSKGANPWLRTIDGETALDVAEADDLRTALQGRQRVHASAPVCRADRDAR